MVWRLTLFVYLLSHRLSVKLLENYLNKPYQFFLENNTIELGKNVLFEIARGVNSAVLPALLTLSKAIIIILIVGLLLMINPQLVLIAAAVLGGAYVLIYMSLSSQLLKEGELAVTSTSAKFKYVTEAFSAIKELKLYDKKDDFVSQYFIESQIYAKSNTNSSMISQIPKYFVETVAFGGIIFAVGMGLLTYQVFIWLQSGVWNEYPMLTVFNFIFENTSIQHWLTNPESWIGVQKLFLWFLESIPVSLALIVPGFSITLTAAGIFALALIFRFYQLKKCNG